MKKVESFLDASEKLEFLTSERVVARKIVSMQEVKKKNQSVVSVNSFLSNRIIELRKTNGNFFECLCVKVKNDDGMTWTAESVYEYLSDRYQTFEFFCFSKRHSIDQIPVISEIIGKISFLKSAVKFKLTKSFITLRSWFSFAIFLTSILLGGVIKFLELLIKKGTAGATWSAFQGDLLIYSIFLAIIGFVSQFIISRTTTKTTSNSVDEFVNKLKENEGKIHYMNLVNNVAERIQLSHFPRFVIIDNYEGLDSFSKKVIETYFAKNMKLNAGSEYWVIFEKEDGDTFSRIALNEVNQNGSGWEKTFLYQQLMLVDDEKARLTTILLKPENVCFSTVKSICRGAILKYPQSYASFHEYRKYHPKNDKKYGTIDFLFLLSLVSKPGGLLLDRKFLEKEMSTKIGLKYHLLSLLLYGTKARIEEISNNLNDLISDFPTMIQLGNEDMADGFRIRPEMADILDAQCDALELPNPKLGHLYWAILWYDNKQNKPLEAFWIRQITYHLMESDASMVDDETSYSNILTHLANVYLFTIDGCLKTCLFQKLFPLLEKAVFIFGIEPLKSNDSIKRRLLKLAWTIFVITGNENIFEQILKIDEMFNVPLGGQYRETNVFNRLFLDLSLIPYMRRETLRSNLLNSIPVPQTNSESILDFIKIKVLWFSFLSSRFSSEISQLDLSSCLADSEKILNEIAGRATDRIIQSNIENIKVLDYVLFSLSLWCLSIRLHPNIVNNSLKKSSVGNGKGDFRQIIEKINAPADLITLLGNFALLIDKIESFLLFSLDAKKRNVAAGNDQGMDFLISGLFHEICIMSMSSLITACVLMSRIDDDDIGITHFFARIKDIFSNFEELLDYSFAEIEKPSDLFADDLINDIDSLMKLTELVWINFALDDFMILSCMRRTQFNVIVRKYSSETMSFHEQIIESLGEAITRSNYSGLLGNILVADSLTLSRELQSYYLCQAATLSMAADFGKNLKNELSLIAIYNNVGASVSLQQHFNMILEKDISHTEKNYFGWICNRLEDDELNVFVLRLYNAIELIENQNQKKQIRNLLAARVAKMQNESLKEEISSFIEIITIVEKLDSKEEVDLVKTRSAWRKRTKIWTYPWLLGIMLKNGNVSESLIKECVAVLNHDPSNDIYNSYFNLAILICQLFANNYIEMEKADSDIPRNYVVKSINKWKTFATAEQNIHTYDILIRTEKNKPQKIAFNGELIKWQLIKINRDHLKRIPEMAKQGDFFLVVNEYFKYMMVWGMTTELSWEQYFNAIEIAQEKRVAKLKSWMDEGAEMPNIITKDKNVNCISSKYLIIGNIIFDPPFDKDKKYDEFRIKFNVEAKNSFKTILNMIINLPNLPNPIKSLLEKHSNKLMKYSLVGD